MTLFNLKIMRLSGYAIISAVIFMLAGTANEINAQESDRRDVRRGNRQFKDGNYKEAVVDYQKALLRDSTSFAASYNLANTLYRMENYSEAKAVLDTVAKAAPSSGYASDYHYNTGNTSAFLKDWQAAVDSYREALLLNPGDLDAKENYIYARKMLENQQNQQNQQDQQDQQDQQGQDGEQDQDKDRNQEDENQDEGDNDNDRDGQNQDGDGNQDQQDNDAGQSPQPQPQISKQAAQQMLNAIMAKEKETQDKVNKEKAAVMQSRQKEKNW